MDFLHIFLLPISPFLLSPKSRTSTDALCKFGKKGRGEEGREGEGREERYQFKSNIGYKRRENDSNGSHDFMEESTEPNYSE